MKRTILVILSVFLMSGQLLAQDSLRIMEGLVMKSRVLNQDVKYSVCLPDDYYKIDRSYPVVYMLHGLGDDETSWLEYGRISQYYDAEIEKGAVAPMIFIMPEGYRTYYVNDYKGTFNYMDMFVTELVPYIDSLFRTIPDARHRGLTGYSMGGFGALILHLQHPDVFGSAVPLSISIRTDEQYMLEYAPEWDEQWGRLFGAVGIQGPGRITDYYKQNSPFYIIPGFSSSEMKNFKIYIDNGDKEQTLCRSNEELHILMRNAGFPHEFRVREGGHSFAYWCSALPNTLHFLDDAFNGKPYRGDASEWKNETGEFKADGSSPVIMDISGETVTAFLPAEYDQTDRRYPVLYVTGNFNDTERNSIAAIANRAIESNEISPMIIIFIPKNLLNQFSAMIPLLEEKFRIRKGYRFRSFMGYQDLAEQVCDIVMNREQFSSCAIIDGYLQKNKITGLLNEMSPDALKKTPFFVIAPDKGNYYEGNGNLHMVFRDKEIKHEYRVVEGTRGFDWMIGGLEEILKFVAINFHR